MSDLLNPSTWNNVTADPAGIIANIPIRILERSGASEEKFYEMTEVYLIPTNRLVDFLRLSFPKPDIINNIPIYNNRALPGSSPTLYPNVRTKRVEWEPFVPDLPLDPLAQNVLDGIYPDGAFYPVTKVTILYTNQKERDAGDPKTYLDIAGSATGEFIHLPQEGSSRWRSASSSEDEVTTPVLSAVAAVPMIEWTVTWSQVPRDYFRDTLIALMRERMGKVNSDTVELLFDAPPDTLLFMGYDMNEEFSVEAVDLPISVAMKFVEKRVAIADPTQEENQEPINGIGGHNYYWRPGVGFQKLFINSTRPTYESDEMEVLFEVSQNPK